MVVEKRGNRWCVVHCHGKDAGKIIACHDTKEEAEAQHRAIQASKYSSTRKMIKIDLIKLKSMLQS